MWIECIKPLCPRKKFIGQDNNLLLLPILEFVSSISGNKEKNKTIITNKILFSILRKLNANKDISKPNAKWV